MLKPRPELNDKISAEDFNNFYWLKAELLVFCQLTGLRRSGPKNEIAGRIKVFLETGKISAPLPSPRPKPSSRFNWNTECLTQDTVITDNYKSTENLRAFFTQHIGKHFRFTVAFMKWAKQNPGKKLAEAISEWDRLYQLKKDKNYKSEIGPQFEYNRYLRDFLADNPHKTSQDARACWKLKRALPGHNQYAKSDLVLANQS